MDIKSTLAVLSLLVSCKTFSQKNAGEDSLPKLPVIHFQKTVFLDAKSKLTLDSVIKIANNYTSFKLRVAGSASSACEFCQQVAWDRTYSVVKYLTQKEFDSTRIIFSYEDYKEDFRAVDLVLTKYDGPAMVPAPHPCYSYHQPKKKRCTNLYGHEKPEL